MADAWKSIKVAKFEHVRMSPSVALLRVSGKPTRRHSRSGPRPVLVADDGHKISRFAALPSPVDERKVLRAAYSVGSDLIEPTTTFSLELSGGGVLPLAAPSPGAARILREPDAEPPSGLDGSTDPSSGSGERRSDLPFKLTELSARVAEAEQARDELETWRGELERRLTDTTDELSAAKAARAHDEAELSRLGGELAESGAKVDLLKAEVETLKEQLAPAGDVPYPPAQRETIARQAGQLAALLDDADGVSGLARKLVEARARAESLRAAASAEPLPPDSAGDGPLTAAREEVAELRGPLAPRESEPRIEVIRRAAEADARELAERELAQAASADA